ncbi:hypothetical protein [Curtobacterium sp. 9128]|uniref:hypothetical protein n=1 Tax=Curtobacterium sp. 9128 TaxID=1793722 RepID=UPI0011A6BFE8|nr:hypothetical protein [Curtobacterium sp. 9128]
MTTHHLRRAAPAAVLVALLTTGVLTAGAAPGTTASPDPDSGGKPSARTAITPYGSFGAPRDVRVSARENGMYISATPVCSGWKSCRSWVRIPAVGIDLKDVSTTNGVLVPWPSSWREGETISSGYVHSYGRDLFGYGWYSTATTSLGAITRPYAARPITARLTGQDDAARTATVTGTATPNASIRRNGVVVATATSSGTWSAVVGGLSDGRNTLTFQQYIDGTYQDQTSVDVVFAPKELLTGVNGTTTTLPAGATTTVFGQLRAAAEITGPGSDATVRFTAPTGTTFPSDLTTIRGQQRPASGGDWTDFPADNLVGGVVSDDGRSVTFRWAPGNAGWKLTPGQEIRFGVPVRNPGTAAGTGELGIAVSGSAPQGSLAASATTPVRIEAGELSPVTRTGPATVAPGTTNTFTGTATPGATYDVVDADGAVIVPGGPFRVSDEGTWSFEAAVAAGATEYSFAIRQTAFGRSATSDLFRVPADTRS